MTTRKTAPKKPVARAVVSKTKTGIHATNMKTPEQILAEALAKGDIAQEDMELGEMQMKNTGQDTVKPQAEDSAPPTAAKKKAGSSSVERIVLPSNMEMSGLEESFKVLRSKYPPTYERCILDGVQLNVIDASGIQLLVNFVSSIKSKGCKVEWDNYSIHAYQLANELGLVDQMGD